MLYRWYPGLSVVFLQLTRPPWRLKGQRDLERDGQKARRDETVTSSSRWTKGG